MTNVPHDSKSLRTRLHGLLLLAGLGMTLVFFSCGDALNPAFIDILPRGIADPQGPGSSGHVVVALRNDAIFDDRVLAFLLNEGLDEELLEDPRLRPMVRMLVNITFANGNTTQVQFLDGSNQVVDPEASELTRQELQRTQQDNLVVQCDVSRVELVDLPEVFVPVFFETTRINPGDENTPQFRERVNVVPPQYERLEIDTVDEFGTTIVQRNIDIRDAPAPAVGPNCGSVVTITFAGTLSVPFEINFAGDDVPGVLNTDFTARERSPGRFEVRVGIR